MKNRISKRELINYLKSLKEMLNFFELENTANIIFYNFDSYIKYVAKQCSFKNKKKYNLEDILDILEPYIPFEFDDKALDFLISSVIEDYDPESFQKILIKRAKVDFINSIKTADTKEEFEQIINKCKNIHEYKELNSFLM